MEKFILKKRSILFHLIATYFTGGLWPIVYFSFKLKSKKNKSITVKSSQILNDNDFKTLLEKNKENYKESNILNNKHDYIVENVHNKREAEFFAERHLQIVKDCTHLVNTTKNPDVFFPRYSLLIQTLEHLVAIEKFGCFKGTLPSQNLNEILAKRVDIINNFIDRYYNYTCEEIFKLKTLNAKQKRVDNFYNNLVRYNNNMDEINIQKYMDYYNGLNKI